MAINLILSLPIDLLRKVDKKLEDAIFAVNIQEIDFKNSLDIIEKLIVLYNTNTSSELVRRFLENVTRNNIDIVKWSEDRLQQLYDILCLIYNNIPHYFLHKSAIDQFSRLCFHIKDLFEFLNTQRAFKKKFADLLYSFSPIAVELLFGIKNSDWNFSLSKESLDQALDYIKNTDTSLFSTTHNRLYLIDIEKIGRRRFRFANSIRHILLPLMKEPKNNKFIIIKILSHPSINQVRSLTDKYKFIEVTDCIQEYLKTEYKKECGFIEYSEILNLINNFILAAPDPLLPISPEVIVKKYKEISNETEFIKFIEVLSKYVNAICNPYVSDKEYCKQAIKTLKDNNIASLCLNKSMKEIDYLKKTIKYLVPIYYHLGDKEIVNSFCEMFTELPASLLAELNSQEMFQLLSVIIKSDVSTKNNLMISALKFSPMILYRESTDKMRTQHEEGKLRILKEYLKVLSEYKFKVNHRSNCKGLPLFAVGYLAIPFLNSLDIETTFLLVKVLSSSNVINYPPEVLSFLSESEEKIFTGFNQRPLQERIELFKYWPSTSLNTS
jgi:hypothetical protein